MVEILDARKAKVKNGRQEERQETEIEKKNSSSLVTQEVTFYEIFHLYGRAPDVSSNDDRLSSNISSITNSARSSRKGTAIAKEQQEQHQHQQQDGFLEFGYFVTVKTPEEFLKDPFLFTARFLFRRICIKYFI